MVWNVEGELHKPKNMTLGSKSPLLVMNAAFHSSPFLIRTLLYPHRMSNFVNKVASRVRLISSGISGNG